MTIILVLAGVDGARAQDDDAEVPLPAQAPVVPEIPDRNPLINSETDEAAEDEDEADIIDEEEEETAEELEEEDREDVASDDAETGDTPPVPSRRTPPERAVRTYDAPIGPPPRPAEWTSEEVAEAREKCENLLTEALFDFEEHKPLREGICGTPAPISLNSVSAGQTVTIRPAAKLNCGMASQFQRWMVEVVQPSAKQHLEVEITGVVNVSSYRCRTRYNDPGQRMSQHAFANALDIAGFITEKGEQIAVEKSWEGDTPQSRFLKEVHAGACKIFGTVLGPEANLAHRDHFHLDMTKRRRGSYCR